MASLPELYFAPRYSQAEAARIIGVPASSLRNWASGYAYLTRGGVRESTSLITLAEPYNSLVVPFAGLAEAYIVKTLRDAGLPMQRIRPAVLALRKEIGAQEALLSGRLKTDGVEVLYEYLDDPDTSPDSSASLAVVRDKQRVFREVVEEHLQTVKYSAEDVISSFYPAKYGGADIIVDPYINSGQPTFEATGIRVADFLGRVEAGEPLDEVIDDFGIDADVARRVLDSHGA